MSDVKFLERKAQSEFSELKVGDVFFYQSKPYMKLAETGFNAFPLTGNPGIAAFWSCDLVNKSDMV